MASNTASSRPKQISAKVILLGEARSGKSSLFYRQYRGSSRGTDTTTDGAPTFQMSQLTQNRGYDTCTRTIIIPPEYQVNLTIKDSVYSQERGQSLSAHFYRGVQAVILMCSLDNEHTLNRLTFWLEEAKLYVKDQKAMFIVVGTKCDIEDSKREITSEMLQSFAAHHDLPAFEVSAKTNEGVNNMLQALANKIVEQHHRTGRSHSNHMQESHPLLGDASYPIGNDDLPFYTTRDANTSCCPCCVIS